LTLTVVQQGIYRPPVNIDAMRGALLVALLLVLSVPACSAIPPIVPTLTVTISPSTMQVTSPPNLTVTAYFNGTVTVDKLPFTRIAVSLTASVGTGWPCSCSPNGIIITDEQPHPFACCVTIPEATANSTANLTVNAVGNGQGFTVTATAQAIITVHGTASTNKTGGTGGTGKSGTNETIPGGSQTSQSGPFKLGPLDATGLAALVAVLALAVVSGVYWIRRGKNARRRIDMSAEAPVGDVQPQ
jgi:hypothetical protein